MADRASSVFTPSARTAREQPRHRGSALATAAHDFAIVQPNPAPQTSVEIEQLAKPGSPPKITVKCYAADVDDAARRAAALYDALVSRYAAPA